MDEWKAPSDAEFQEQLKQAQESLRQRQEELENKPLDAYRSEILATLDRGKKKPFKVQGQDGAMFYFHHGTAEIRVPGMPLVFITDTPDQRTDVVQASPHDIAVLFKVLDVFDADLTDYLSPDGIKQKELEDKLKEHVRDSQSETPKHQQETPREDLSHVSPPNLDASELLKLIQTHKKFARWLKFTDRSGKMIFVGTVATTPQGRIFCKVVKNYNFRTNRQWAHYGWSLNKHVFWQDIYGQCCAVCFWDQTNGEFWATTPEYYKVYSPVDAPDFQGEAQVCLRAEDNLWQRILVSA